MDSDWRPSYDRARTLMTDRRLDLAGYYLLHALARAPGEMMVIRAVADCARDDAQALAQTQRIDEALRRLDWADGFLLERLPFVALTEVDVLLEISAVVRRERVRFAHAADAEGEVSPEEEAPREVMEELRGLRSDGLDTTLPEGTPALEERLARVTALKDHIAAADVPCTETQRRGLDTLLGKLQTALSFETLIEEAQQHVALAKEHVPAMAAYLLQHAESAVRQLILFESRLNDKSRSRLAQLIDELRAVSAASVERVSEEESRAAWNAFELASSKQLAEVKQWRASGMRRDCEDQIARIRAFMRRMQEVLPKLTHTGVARDAAQRLDRLNEQLHDTAMLQQRRYNEWAMEAIETGYKHSRQHVGVVTDDEKKIANVLVSNLGPVDPRLLTNEVHRCYSEVFEDMFKKLKGPSDEKDFEKDGSKLRVLKDVFEMQKRALSDF